MRAPLLGHLGECALQERPIGLEAADGHGVETRLHAAAVDALTQGLPEILVRVDLLLTLEVRRRDRLQSRG